MNSLALRFSRFFIRHRHVHLAIIGALTLFFGYHALQLQVFSQFIDLLPRSHPFIQVYEKYNQQYGSANVVAAALIARQGTVYDERFLEKLYGFTDQIDKIEGVDHAQVASLTHPSQRVQEINREGVLRSEQIVGSPILSLLETQFLARRLIRYAAEQKADLPADVEGLKALAQRLSANAEQTLAPTANRPLEQIADPATAAEVRRLRKLRAEIGLLLLRLQSLPPDYRLQGEDLIGPSGKTIPPELLASLPDRVHADRQVYGRFVSRDDSAALITAGFVEGRLDYSVVFHELQALQKELEADGTIEVHLTGQPVLVGWTFAFLGEILLILFLSISVLIALLGVYFRRWYGVVMPLTGAAVSAVWGLGFVALMGYQLEPLVLVIPMLITARAISHSVQFCERFFEEYERLRDKEEAVVSSMAELLLPGTLAILTDGLGIFVIGVSSIALMKKLAIFGAFWALSIAVTEMLLNRLMIAYFPPPRTTVRYVWPPAARALGALGRLATSRRAPKLVFAAWLLVVLGAAAYAPRVKIGEPRPGTPILYPDHPFNQSAAIIGSKFFGADELVVVVEGPQQGSVYRPDVLREIEAFQRYMEDDPKVGGTISVVDFAKAVNRTFHNGDPRWFAIPATDQEVGGLLYFFEAGSADPRILSPYRDLQARSAAVRLYYADHQGQTVARALARAKRFLRERPAGGVSIALEIPGDDWRAAAYRWVGPLLPPRTPDFRVEVRGEDGSYERQSVSTPGRTEAAPEDSQARLDTLPRVTHELRLALVEVGYDRVAKLAGADVTELARVPGYDLATAHALIQAARLDRRSYRVAFEWRDEARGVHAQVRKRGWYEPYELWVRYQGQDWERRESGRWSEGPSFALASGLLGVLAASNDEVEGSNNATLLAAFATTFLILWLSYRSLSIAVLMIVSLGTASLVSLAYMYFADIGFDVNTLPVQALGVGVGVDYALYIMDRVVWERRRGHSLEESLQIAVQTTGMAVLFTASTLLAGIGFWYFVSSLRFAADMSLLLVILLTGNMIGAILLIPAFTALFRPRFAQSPAGAAEPAREERAPDALEADRTRIASGSARL